MLEEFFKGYPAGTGEFVALTAALSGAYLVAEVSTRLVKRFVGGFGAGDVPARASLRSTLRLVRVSIFLLTAVLLVFPALRAVGMTTDVGLSPEALGRWAAQSGLRVGLIVLMAWLITHVAGLVAARLEAGLDDATTVDVIERAKRARTIGDLLYNAVFVLVSLVATLMVLRELGLDVTPILAGAGIVGLAVGFGAQSLVKDVISGFFIILENQVRVGDVANIDGTGGAVERITLRVIILRDMAGTVHVIPNGSIQRLSNLTKDFAYYVVDIGVAYKEDTDVVVEVMKKVADDMLGDARYATSMLSALEVIGVNRFGESSVEIRVRIKTIPLKQWEVGREFLRRVKKAFDAHGIEIPFPYRTLVLPAGMRIASDDAATPPEPAAARTTTTPPGAHA